MNAAIADDATLFRRALVAYFRTGGTDQPSNDGGVTEHDGLLYVVLSNAHRTLAVYRVHNDGALRRMKRWPREVAPREGE